MTSSLWSEVKRVLSEALELPREKRAAFLADHCADDSVRAEVVRLLELREREQVSFTSETERRSLAETPSLTVGPDGRVGTRTGPAEYAASEPPPPIAPGVVLGGRYEIEEGLGAGAFGTVHRALDRLTGRKVAVKVLTHAASADPHGLRREVAVLRRARLPGLVEMLDDGIDHGRAFLVMRLVEGSPFPGRLVIRPPHWAEVAPRAIALVEALGRLHWLGVLHRDVKPENVLVGSRGAVTIVDLGVARHVDGFGDAWQGYLVGTPSYLAPERAMGAPATVASDLYAAGVMLYEMLAGRPPRIFQTYQEMVRERATSAPPIRSLAPEVPEHVARAIDSMVDVLPERRPRSARVAAAMLRGQDERAAGIRLPLLGSESAAAAVAAVVDAVRARRAIDVAGTHGSGRTRLLDEAERRLAADGYRILRTRPATEPFGSLLDVMGALPAEPGWTVADVRAWLVRCFRYWLRVNVAVFADDWDFVDAATREVLEAVLAEGAVVRVLAGAHDGAVLPPAISESDLRELFRGPDRVFHLREDGAKELWRRTAGNPRDIVREIETWIDGGIARWEEERILLDRAGIERLETRLALALRHADLAHDALPQACVDVAAVLEIAACPVPVECVARVAGLASWQVDAELDRLAGAGLARRSAGGSAEAVLSIDAAAGWPADRRRAAHAAIADVLPQATERRLFHLLACDDFHRYASEAADATQRCLDEGNAERAVALLSEIISATNRMDSVPTTRIDSAAWLLLDTALALSTPAGFDRIAAEFERSRHVTESWTQCTAICEAAGVSMRGDPRRALEMLRDVPAQDSAHRRLRFLAVRSMAARVARDHATQIETLREGARLARHHRDAEARGYFQDWLGWLRYGQLRFACAATLHGRAARRRRTVRGRAIAMTNAASCHIQAANLESARRWAQRAERVAAHARIALAEARAAWLLRRVAWKDGTAAAADEELVEAIRGRMDASFEANVCLQEATIALHAGHARTAGELAARARTLAEGLGSRVVISIADGMAAASASGGAWQAAMRAFAEGITTLPTSTGFEVMAISAPFVPAPGAADLARALESAREDRRPGVAAHDLCRDDEILDRLAAGLDRC